MNIIKQFINQPHQKTNQHSIPIKKIQSSHQEVNCNMLSSLNKQKQRFNFTAFDEASSNSQMQIQNEKEEDFKLKQSKRQKMLQKRDQKIKSQKLIQSSKKTDNDNRNNVNLSASQRRFNLFTEVLSSVGERQSNVEFQSPSLSFDNPNKDDISIDKKNKNNLQSMNKKRQNFNKIFETQQKKKKELRSSIKNLAQKNKALQDSISEIGKAQNGKSYKIIDLGEIYIPTNQAQLYSSLLLNYQKDYTIRMEKFEVNTHKQKNQPLAFINKKLESNLISKFYWGKRQKQIYMPAPQSGGLPPLPPKNKIRKQK